LEGVGIMTKQQLKEWIDTGRELDFEYQGNEYSITYYKDNRNDYISFCQYYQDTLDVSSVDVLWNFAYKGIALADMLS
jgi:hypothetical protein